MKKLTNTLLFIGLTSVTFYACKKEDSTTDNPTTTGTTATTATTATTSTTSTTATPPAKMPSIVGVWVASGNDIAPDDRSSFSELMLDIKSDSTCTWTKTNKSNPSGTLVMTGNIMREPSGEKDANGLIDRIWFSFNKINGESFSGTAFGIYQAKGNKLKIDWTFMDSGASYADASKGFGSSDAGEKTVSTYTK